MQPVEKTNYRPFYFTTFHALVKTEIFRRSAYTHEPDASAMRRRRMVRGSKKRARMFGALRRKSSGSVIFDMRSFGNRLLLIK
jgi:hypothetical protein